jgi:hypothetical protein
LVREHLAVRQLHALEDAAPRQLDVRRVGIARVDELLRQPVRAEQHTVAIAPRLGIARQPLDDGIAHRVQVAAVCPDTDRCA